MEYKRNSTLIKFGKKIRDEREKKGLSQEQLGFKCDLDRTYISGIERAIRNPSLLTIEKIAKALKVKLSDLVNF